MILSGEVGNVSRLHVRLLASSPIGRSVNEVFDIVGESGINQTLALPDFDVVVCKGAGGRDLNGEDAPDGLVLGRDSREDGGAVVQITLNDGDVGQGGESLGRSGRRVAS
jgi:hypothetical protein